VTRRLLASYLLLTVAVLLVLVIPLGLSFADREEQDLLEGLQIDAFALASFAEDTLEHSPEGGASDAALEEEPDVTEADVGAAAAEYTTRTGARVVVIDTEGRAIADSQPPTEGERYFDTRDEFATALEGQVATGSRASETLGGRLVYAAVPVASGGVVRGAVRLTYPADELDARVRDNWYRLGAIAVVSLVAATVVGVVLARSVTRPVRDLQQAATALGGGDLAVRADPTDGPREVRALARDFNDMADRLAELVDAQEAFVADASHQLRSPLTALRLRLENLEETVGPDDRSEVEAAGREVARMSRLVDGLLALARADRAAGSATAEPVALGALLAERADVWRPLAEERSVALSVSGDGAASLSPDRLAQVLDNLVANALEVAPAGSDLALRVVPAARAGWVEVHVIDAGPGLTDEERERAFDRFWRAGRDGGTLGGSGLGLAIVQKLVRVDGGTVELRRADTGGIDAVVTYPAADAATAPPG
jgi:signal transduction histidine kinase